jgi:hypothetical protein
MKQKIVATLLVLVVIGLVAFRLLNPEDNWICQNGEWVKHGNPSKPQPTDACPVSDSVDTLSTSPQTQAQKEVSVFVRNFFDSYLQSDKSILSDGEYKNNSYITDNFKKEISEILSSSTGAYDPIVCAQDKPKRYSLGLINVKNNDTFVALNEEFDSGTNFSLIHLVRNGDQWQIEDIDCNLPTSASSTKNSSVVIYFNNSNRANGNTDCGLVYGVERKNTGSDQYDFALKQLFQGTTSDEKSQGYSSMFSVKTKDILKGLKIINNTAYVNLTDIRNIIPNASTSCGSQSFLKQVEETLKHDRKIKDVRFAINGDPQTFYDWIQIGCDKKLNNCDPKPFSN